MVTIYEGSIFNSESNNLVNFVNCQGIISTKDLLDFSLRYPDSMKLFKADAKAKKVVSGNVTIYEANNLNLVLIPIKDSYQDEASLSYLEAGLTYLKENYKALGLNSLAVGLIKSKEFTEGDFIREIKKFFESTDLKVYLCLDKIGAMGIEKAMLEILVGMDLSNYKEAGIKDQQAQKIMVYKKAFKRISEISYLDSVGSTTYNKLYTYLYNKALEVAS